MFDFIRAHHKAIQLLLFIFVLPGFFLFGIEGFNRMRGADDAVAMVDGQQISTQEFEASLKQDIQRYAQQFPQLDAKVFDSPQFRQGSLARLVQQRTFDVAVRKLHLEASDQQLAQELLQNPTLAALRDAGGKVDAQRYREFTQLQGLTPQDFEGRVRQELSMRLMLETLAKSALAPASIADVALNAFFEKREIQILPFMPSDFVSRVSVSEQALADFYKAHTRAFETKESADIEYVILDLDSVKKTIVVSEADLKTYYEQNADRQGESEQRRASHILIAVDRNASAAQKQQAREKAQALLTQVKKAPETFAEVAKTHSQDPGSAPQGGDLGTIARGSGMVKAFEDAVFALSKVGQISEVVETQFGYHIVLLQDIKTPERKSFAQMHDVLRESVRTQEAQKKFAELAEIFTNTVYEQPDSLRPVADKLKLEIKTAQGLRRESPAAQNANALLHPKFLAALFRADAIEKKHNTEAVELGGGRLIAGRVTRYESAHTLPLEQIKSRVQSLYAQSQSIELARKAGIAALAQARKSSDAPSGLGATLEVSRDAPTQENPRLVEAVMRARTVQLPVWIGVDLGEQGYRVVRVNKVQEGSQLFVGQNRSRYLQAWSEAEGNAYYNYLKTRLKVQTNAFQAVPASKS